MKDFRVDNYLHPTPNPVENIHIDHLNTLQSELLLKTNN